jgi:DNA-binding MarR family transcriptional regulator
MITETSATTENVVCMRRLMQLLPLVARGIKRSQDRSAPETIAPLGPRHLAALEHLRDGPLTVGALAAQLDLTLSTVSGVLADLDRAGYVVRSADAGDRRRTIVRIAPEKQPEIQQWLECAAAPLARVIHQLGPAEQAAFLKVMDLLEAEMRNQDPKR